MIWDLTQLRIGEAVIDIAICVRLDDRKDPQGLAEHGEFLGVDTQLAGLGNEGESLDTDYVADVEELLPDGIVHRLVLSRAYLIPLDVDLDPARGILELSERSRTHDPAGHQPSGYAHFLEIALLRIISFLDALCGGIDRIKRCRIRIDAQFP